MSEPPAASPATARAALRPVAVPARKAARSSEATLVGLCLLAWWLVQMLQPLFSPPPTPVAQQIGKVVVDQSTTAVQQGSALNTVLVVAYAALGALFLPRALRARQTPALIVLAALLGLYLAWGWASILWSDDPSLSVRRVIQTSLLVVGSYGLGAGFFGRSIMGHDRLAWYVLAAGGVGLGTLALALVQSGSANILDPAFAAKGIGLGTTVAHPIAYASFAAIYLWRRRLLNVAVASGYVLSGLFALFVMKVRLISAYSAALLAVLFLTRIGWRRSLALFGTLGFLGSLALSVAADVDTRALQTTLQSYERAGQTGQDFNDLSGRVQLWTELQHYVAAQPYTGYGFGAFWNPDHLQKVAQVIFWAPVVAHNGYLDEVLGVGLIGASISLAFWVIATLVAGLSAGDDFAALVACWSLLFLLLNWGDSLFQDYFRFPFYASLIGLFALTASPDSRRAA